MIWCLAWHSVRPITCTPDRNGSNALHPPVRNVYTLFDYGDFIPSSDEKDPPYIQLLSTTEPSEAHRDFVAIRLGGIDVPPRPLLNSPSTGADAADDDEGTSKKTVAAAIGASVAVIGVLLIVVAILVFRMRRRRLRMP